MFRKFLIFLVVISAVSALSLYSQGLPNKIYDSGCQLPLDLKTAIVMDLNQDRHYESMQTIWCDLERGIEFPIMSPIIYPIEGSKGTPINDVAVEPLPWKKLRKKPQLTEFTIEIYISELNPIVLFDYKMVENDPNVYYTQYVPYTDVEEISESGVRISPNPANSTSSITFNMVNDNNVIIKLYSQNGQEIAVIDNGFRTAGENEVSISTNSLSSGVYFVHTLIGTQTYVTPLYVVK